MQSYFSKGEMKLEEDRRLKCSDLSSLVIRSTIGKFKDELKEDETMELAIGDYLSSPAIQEKLVFFTRFMRSEAAYDYVCSLGLSYKIMGLKKYLGPNISVQIFYVCGPKLLFIIHLYMSLCLYCHRSIV